MPGSDSLAGTNADDSIPAIGGGDVIHVGGGLPDGGRDLDAADHDDPMTTAMPSTIAVADSNTPGDQPDRVHAHPVIK